MEWVEITGKTIEEAKDVALDQLGVDVDEAEFEILDEPKAGLFGRVRGEARVRARVRPTAPRSKESNRRGRGRRDDDATSGTKSQVRGDNGGRAEGAKDPAVASAIAEVTAAGDTPVSAQRNGASGGDRSGNRRRGGRGRGGQGRTPRPDGESSRGEPVSVEALEEQGKVAVSFLNGQIGRAHV